MKNIANLFHTYGTMQKFTKGQQIFYKGDPANEIYYLEQGRVRAYLLYPDGTERTLCYVEAGNLVGEEIMSADRLRIVNTDASEDLVMYGLGKKTVLSCDQSTLEEILALFMKKIELLSEWIFYGQFKKAEEKVAYFLYSNSTSSSAINYRQDQIAEVIGITRASVSRCLHRFSEEGLVKNAYRKLYITDREGLSKYFRHQSF